METLTLVMGLLLAANISVFLMTRTNKRRINELLQELLDAHYELGQLHATSKQSTAELTELLKQATNTKGTK